MTKTPRNRINHNFNVCVCVRLCKPWYLKILIDLTTSCFITTVNMPLTDVSKLHKVYKSSKRPKKQGRQTGTGKFGVTTSEFRAEQIVPCPFLRSSWIPQDPIPGPETEGNVRWVDTDGQQGPTPEPKCVNSGIVEDTLGRPETHDRKDKRTSRWRKETVVGTTRNLRRRSYWLGTKCVLEEDGFLIPRVGSETGTEGWGRRLVRMVKTWVHVNTEGHNGYQTRYGGWIQTCQSRTTLEIKLYGCWSRPK